MNIVSVEPTQKGKCSREVGGRKIFFSKDNALWEGSRTCFDDRNLLYVPPHVEAVGPWCYVRTWLRHFLAAFLAPFLAGFFVAIKPCLSSRTPAKPASSLPPIPVLLYAILYRQDWDAVSKKWLSFYIHINVRVSVGGHNSGTFYARK